MRVCGRSLYGGAGWQLRNHYRGGCATGSLRNRLAVAIGIAKPDTGRNGHTMKTISRNLLAPVMMGAVLACAPGLAGEIHEAVNTNDVAKVRKLLEADLRLMNDQDAEGRTPLHLAVRNSCKEMVRFFLALNATVNVRDRLGETPLHSAIRTAGTEVVELLLLCKADVSARDNKGQTPLHWAVMNSRRDVVKSLLASRADVNARDKNGVTPLHLAAHQNNGDLVKMLLSRKADVNAKDNQGITPIHLSSIRESKDVTELLVAHKADINSKDGRGRTTLDHVQNTGSAEMAAFIRQHGGKSGKE